MTLKNLLGKKLEQITPNSTTINHLLLSAARNIDDAKITSISNETRFDAAYKAIMQSANAALQASGYRTLTSQPGHHQLMIQTLTKTIGVNHHTIIVLDTLRKQRNMLDYSGDVVTQAMMAECITQADILLKAVKEFLAKEYPELLV